MEIVKIKEDTLRKDTTITIKVSRETKKEWELFCIKNDVNQKETLTNVLNSIMKKGEILWN